MPVTTRNRTTYLLLDRDENPVVVTPKEEVAEEWSESGKGDYRELEVVYAIGSIERRGGFDDGVARN